MLGAAEVLAYIHLQIRFCNKGQRNTHLPAGSILKKHVVAVYSQQTAPEIALPRNRLPRLHLCVAACEALEVGAFVQAPFESRRRYLQGVGSMNKVFHIQNRPEMS